MAKTLIFIPTYNEKGNCPRLIEEFRRHNLNCDVLFLDDNSTDGTGQEQDDLASNNPNIFVIHRSGKLGIGTAHQAGIKFAYEKKYDRLITMDADFTHPPEFIPALMVNKKQTDIVIGSRHLVKGSIAGWNIFRRIMTKAAHFMTTWVLNLPYDTTNAFRLYELKRIPAAVFGLVESKSYSFFYESVFVFQVNKISMSEIPMRLPPREAGSSKMRLGDAWRSVYFLFVLKFKSLNGQKQLPSQRRAA